MAVCTGRGDTGAGHCCWVNGEVCQFLFTDRGGTPRCSVWDEMDTQEYRDAPIGRSFAKEYPGKQYTCRDWPQNIPSEMEQGIGLCCWQGVSDGNVG